MTTNEAIIAAHVKCNVGIYFDGQDSLGDGLFYVYSNLIEDGYWNFGYKADGSALSLAELDRVASCAILHARALTVWQTSEQPRLPGWEVLAEEIWMTADLASVGGADHVRGSVREHKTPSEPMVEVFEDAYGGNACDGDVGYSALPEEYGQAYRHGASQPPAESWVIEAVVDSDITAAVASVCVVGNFAGVFSVATRHSHRRQGLGRFVSAAVLDIAKRERATVAFLQTEPDSAVQKMYESLGFEARFLGNLLAPSDSINP